MGNVIKEYCICAVATIVVAVVVTVLMSIGNLFCHNLSEYCCIGFGLAAVLLFIKNKIKATAKETVTLKNCEYCSTNIHLADGEAHIICKQGKYFCALECSFSCTECEFCEYENYEAK